MPLIHKLPQGAIEAILVELGTRLKMADSVVNSYAKIEGGDARELADALHQARAAMLSGFDLVFDEACAAHVEDSGIVGPIPEGYARFRSHDGTEFQVRLGDDGRILAVARSRPDATLVARSTLSRIGMTWSPARKRWEGRVDRDGLTVLSELHEHINARVILEDD